MTHKPRVSILMPVYKTAQYLPQALESILRQTYTDYELIILNDCSPDNAEDILDTYHDERIVRYKGKENVGLANILNVGIKMAQGEYIARMDSDDLCLPERLQTQVEYLDKHTDIDLCSTGMQLFGAQKERWIREHDTERVKTTALFFSPVLHASSMWRKEAFISHHLYFRQEMVPAEDYDLWTRALLSGLRLTNLPQPLYLYRIHSTNATLDTEKSKSKCREIQHAYLSSALPSLGKKLISRFPSNRLSDYIRIYLANIRYHFFPSKTLANRLIRYYLGLRKRP